MSTPYNNPDLDEAIRSVFADLRGFDIDSDEYAKANRQLSMLHQLKMKEVSTSIEQDSKTHARVIEDRKLALEEVSHTYKRELDIGAAQLDERTRLHTMNLEDRSLEAETLRHKRLSYDTLAIVAGNLIGIAIIVGHERAHIVASKALGFIKSASR